MRQFFLVTFMASIAVPVWGSDPPPMRARVAVGQFEMSDTLANNAAPSTLTDLLLEVGGNNGVRYEAVAATGDLQKVVEWMQLKGQVPSAEEIKIKKEDFTKLVSETGFLLRPTLSKLGEDWVMTGRLVDLRSGETRVVKVKAKGGTEALESLVQSLWAQINAPSLRAILKGHESRYTTCVDSLTFSPDGKRLVSGASRYDTARLWDSLTGRELAALSRHGSNGVCAVAFSPDGKIIATGSEGETSRLWDAGTGMVIASLVGQTATVMSLAFSSDGRLLGTGSSDGLVYLWDPSNGKKRITITHSIQAEWIKSIAFDPEGMLLATAGTNSPARLWETGTGKERATLTGQVSVNMVRFSPDGSYVATAGYDKTARLWNRDGKELAKLEGHAGSVEAVEFSPDGWTLATAASNDNVVRLWSVPFGKELVKLSGHKEMVWRVAFSPDGKTLATASQDGTARLWDPGTGKEVASLSGHTDSVLALAWSRDGQLLATGSRDQTVRLWEVGPPR